MIKITESNGKQAVDARELYTFLDVETPFSKWMPRMLAYGFEENTDWTKMSSKNQAFNIDYAITLDCAKEISMIQRTDKGKLARKYFIECEKQLNSQSQLPQTFAEALRLAANQAEQLELQAPKIKFADNIIKSEDNISMSSMAKLIGMGRNKLFKRLRDDKVLMSGPSYRNTPYQKHVDAGHFVVTETNIESRGLVLITLVTPKGQNYIINKLK